MSADPIFMYDDPTSAFHDYKCRCAGHCRNCFAVLPARRRLYCSDGCGIQYRQAIAFDRMMSERGPLA